VSHRCLARRAPGCPEVKKDDLSSFVLHIDFSILVVVWALLLNDAHRVTDILSSCNLNLCSHFNLLQGILECLLGLVSGLLLLGSNLSFDGKSTLLLDLRYSAENTNVCLINGDGDLRRKVVLI